MNLKPIIVEVLMIVAVVALAFMTLNPYEMPMGTFLTTLIALIVLFGFFALFVWREKGNDEREIMLVHRSDRIAFLVGASVLLIAIVVEGVTMHMTDRWVLGAFSVMIIAKSIAYIYHQNKH